MKELKLTISDDMWQEYKAAVSIKQGFDVDDAQAEEIAKMDMWKGMQSSMRDTQHPESGLSKQEMVHFRRGETEARMWLHGNKEATCEEFEQAGKMWLKRSKSAEHVQELLLKGWMSVWKD